jgi:hypothetical protein
MEKHEHDEKTICVQTAGTTDLIQRFEGCYGYTAFEGVITVLRNAPVASYARGEWLRVWIEDTK